MMQPEPTRAPVLLAALLLVMAWPPATAQGQSVERPSATSPQEPHFHTFSIAAIDPDTGESGVAVTTRVACVGNAVPWVRAGVGAVATQSFTRMEYGPELLDLMEAGVSPGDALDERVAEDDGRDRRQVGVINTAGEGAQFTGEEAMPWAGERRGPNHVTQGNLLVGPEVVEAVAQSFEATEGSGRHLADRLTEALMAGQEAGGDARRGRLQSAAILIADPRSDVATRPDQVSVNLNICEHPEPVRELRRQYEAVSGTLGFRTLELPVGPDVGQLRLLLHALGYYRPGEDPLPRDDDFLRFTPGLVEAVDRFREEEGLSTPAVGSPPGWVDREAVERLWALVEAEGLGPELREQVRDLTQIRR